MTNEETESDYANTYRGFGIMLIIAGLVLLAVATGAIIVAGS